MQKKIIPLIFTLLLSATANAAEPAPHRQAFHPAPVMTQVNPVAQPFDWNRCFAGAQIGTKAVRSDLKLSTTEFVTVEYVDEQKTNLFGAHAGLQAGCNRMLANGLVIGFEIEGVYGPKASKNCATRIDPLAYCIEYEKDREFFLSGRIGKTFDGFSLCDCGGAGALLLYTRLGAGYTRTEIKANFNQVSYRTEQTQFPGPTNTYQPVWGNVFDMTGTKSFISPMLGFGFEYALDQAWTVRGEMAGMLSSEAGSKLTVKKVKTSGSIPNDDSTGVERHATVGDVMNVRLQEIETKFSFGVNRHF